MKTNYESFVLSFLEYLELELNYSKKTIKTYNDVLKEYGIFLNTNNYNFLNITKDIALKYKAHLISSNYDNKTSSLHLSSVRSFMNYLVEIKATSNNPYLGIKNPKIVKKLPNFLNNNETKEILKDRNELNDLEIRNSFIIEFLYASGIRVSELCNIKIKDMDQNSKTIRIIGKGNKERIVFYKAIDDKHYNYYINARNNILNGVVSEYFFTSKSGKALSTRTVEKIVKDYGIREHIKGKVTPHTLRHTYATELLNHGADIRSVGELLGHESLSTTQIYTHITGDRLKSVYKKTHPREKLKN